MRTIVQKVDKQLTGVVDELDVVSVAVSLVTWVVVIGISSVVTLSVVCSSVLRVVSSVVNIVVDSVVCSVVSSVVSIVVSSVVASVVIVLSMSEIKPKCSSLNGKLTDQDDPENKAR